MRPINSFIDCEAGLPCNVLLHAWRSNEVKGGEQKCRARGVPNRTRQENTTYSRCQADFHELLRLTLRVKTHLTCKIFAQRMWKKIIRNAALRWGSTWPRGSREACR